ncbi:hypothetical protein [Polymorphospora rubra]|uniref:Uncharacterized protein n=1 Tax=Polymorphospora rubra TaxID=338584 RepID=A0A810MT82_9ACTN|nr:hypothetical protein [Polymorphospora rubra]BCJ64162.1 hypothetical protein Prubr_11830 [Polymorphospora rubra]
MSLIQKYGKAGVAVVFAGLTAAYAALGGDQHVDPVEWVAIATAAAQAILVWLVPLVPSAPWLKTAVNGALAVLGVLTVAIVGGLDNAEVVLMLLAGLSVLGVGVAPSASTTTAGPGRAPVTTSVGWGSGSPRVIDGELVTR